MGVRACQPNDIKISVNIDSICSIRFDTVSVSTCFILMRSPLVKSALAFELNMLRAPNFYTILLGGEDTNDLTSR